MLAVNSDGGLKIRFAHIYLTAGGLVASPAAGTASEIASEGRKASSADLDCSGLAGEAIVSQPIGGKKEIRKK